MPPLNAQEPRATPASRIAANAETRVRNVRRRALITMRIVAEDRGDYQTKPEPTLSMIAATIFDWATTWTWPF